MAGISFVILVSGEIWMFCVQWPWRYKFVVFVLPKTPSKVLYKFYFRCIFIIYLILFYVNDSVGLTEKKNAISPRLLCYTTVILAFHHSAGKPTKCFEGACPCLLYDCSVSVPILSKLLFSYLILYITQWTSAKKTNLIWIKCNLC